MLSVVGAYETRTDAYDRELAVAAMQAPHWILRHGDGFAICVEPIWADRVARELGRYEAEREKRGDEPAQDVVVNPGALAWRKFSPISLWMCGWILTALYGVELAGPKWWLDRGTAASREIMQGEWWRVITALTLHANLGHLGANLAAGLVYAGLLLPIFGTGWTWVMIVAAGGAGNWLNAWGHRDAEHLSIGASTAVFGALGLLVGAQCMTRVIALRVIKARELLLPIGAGLGLLAYLGVGDVQTDYTAHFFGLIAGVPLGAFAIRMRLGERTPPRLQSVLAWAAAGVVMACWALAADSK